MTDASEWGRKVAASVKSFISTAIQPLSERLAALESRAAEIPVSAHPVSAEEVAKALEGQFAAWALGFERKADEVLQRAADRMPAGVPGKSVELCDVLPALQAQMADHLAGIQAPTVEAQDVARALEGQFAAWALGFERKADEVLQQALSRMPAARRGRPGRPGESGKGVELSDVLPALQAQVADHLAGIRAPAADAQDVAKALEGKFAVWALGFERKADEVLQRAADRIPIPKDGRDALELDDFDLKLSDDGRTVVMSLKRGDTVIEKRVSFPTVVDQGVYKEGEDYVRHDAVSFGGSLWIAQVDRPEGRPGVSKEWRLAVKCGRAGKDGRDGIDMTAPVKVST